MLDTYHLALVTRFIDPSFPHSLCVFGAKSLEEAQAKIDLLLVGVYGLQGDYKCFQAVNKQETNLGDILCYYGWEEMSATYALIKWRKA